MTSLTSITETVENIIRQENVPDSVMEEARTDLTNMMTHEAFNNPNYKWSINDFELGKYLGSGKFGQVYVAREKKCNYRAAIKTLSKYEIARSHVEKQVLREIEIQSHLRHPNILKLLTWFHDDYRIYLVLQYAVEGELYHHLRKSPNGCFNSQRSARYVYQVADALNYCHLKKVIHRDIKPENLLLTFDDTVLLSDFGWSVHTQSLKRKTMCGTLDYLPPEIITKQQYGVNVDLWCLGVLCYEFLVGYPPFETETENATYTRIKTLDIKYPSHLDKGAVDLISKLLVISPLERLKLGDVMQHPWITQNK